MQNNSFFLTIILILVGIFTVYVPRLHWKEVQSISDGGGMGEGGRGESVQHPNSYNRGKKSTKSDEKNIKDCSHDSKNETDSEQNMTQNKLVWMTIGVNVNENKNSAGDIKEDFKSILQRMETMALKNKVTENNYVEDGCRNRRKDVNDRKNERVNNDEYHAEWSTTTGDSPITYSFNKILTPTIYHSFLSNITCTSRTKSTHRTGNSNNHHNQNKQHEIRSEKNNYSTGVDINEKEVHVMSTCDEDFGSAKPNRFWILVGTRPSAVLEIREYSGIEVLDPQFFINDVSFQIFNSYLSYKITDSARKYDKFDERSIERDTFYRIEKEKMKNILLWGRTVSRTIENFVEKQQSCDLLIQLEKENEMLVRHRDFIMTLQSSSILANSSREIGCEKNSVIMNHSDTFEMNKSKKAIHINDIEKNGNENINLPKEKKGYLKERSSPTNSEDSSARTRTSDQRMFFTEKLKLLIEQQCVRTMDFLSSLNLTVTQASSNICVIL